MLLYLNYLKLLVSTASFEYRCRLKTTFVLLWSMVSMMVRTGKIQYSTLYIAHRFKSLVETLSDMVQREGRSRCRYKVPNIKVPNHKIPNNKVPNNEIPK